LMAKLGAADPISAIVLHAGVANVDTVIVGLPLRTRRIFEPALRRQLVRVYRAQGPFSRVMTAFVHILGKELKEAMAPPSGRRGQAKIANWLKSGVSYGKIRPSADRQSSS
jgi:hypothetical protein